MKKQRKNPPRRPADGQRRRQPVGPVDLEKEERKRRQRRAQIRRVRKQRQIVACCALVFFVFMLVFTVKAVGKSRTVDINMKVKNAEMLQYDGMPEFETTISYEENKKDKKLDRSDKKTVEDLIKELNSGKHYEIVCDAIGDQEGVYPIQIKLSKEFQENLEGKWKKRINLVTEDGKLTVKNKVGEWDGNKFKRWDGSYVTSDFVTVKGDTYYFDQNGEKITGERKIGFATCVFDEDGKLVSKETSIDPDMPMMALTFDDGPGDYTNELLDVLEKYNAHATFFMLGNKISGREAVVSRMHSIGCELANHSYDHPQLTKLDAAGIQGQIGETNRLVQEAAGASPTLLRPPYGAHNEVVSANAGLPLILWNVDTLDWKTKDPQAVVNHMSAYADDGDIVLLHDIHQSTVEAMKIMIPQLVEQGYQLVTVSELAEARGITLENGVAYTDFNR